MRCARCEEPIEDCQAGACPLCGADPLLDGRYRLEAVLGHGAVGTTWRATVVSGDEAGATVAIKEMPLRHVDSAKARELVHREARILRELHHPAIPAYHDDFIAGAGRLRSLYIVQEHIDGRTLAEEAKERRYSQDEVLEILHELLGILQYLHGLSPPVVHRDLKPGNVMRRKDGRLALIDFGAVRDVVKGELGGSTVAGTFGYMAPEQFQGDAVPATDLFGLGALAIALLTRREPQSMMDYAGRIQWREYAMVSAAVASVLDDLVATDLGRRIPNVGVAFERIEVALAALRRPAEPWVPHVPKPLFPADPAEDGVEVALARIRETRWALRPPHALLAERPRPKPWRGVFPDVQTTALIERGAIELFVELLLAWAPSPRTAAVAGSVVLAMFTTVMALVLVGAGVAVAWGEEQPAPVTSTIGTRPASAPTSDETIGLEFAFLRDPAIRGCIVSWEERLTEPLDSAALVVTTHGTSSGVRLDYHVLRSGASNADDLLTCLEIADDGFAAETSMGAGSRFEIPIGH